MTTVSVVIPTVTGREQSLARCQAAYLATVPTWLQLELLVELDRPTCGEAWARGAERATGDYLHFTADDLEPHPGWWEPAIAAADGSVLPAPVVYWPDGRVQSDEGIEDWAPAAMTRVPFCSRRQWRWLAPVGFWEGAHYYTDNAFSLHGRRAGCEIRVRTGYAFTHRMASVGRGAGMSEQERMEHDGAKWRRYLEGAA